MIIHGEDGERLVWQDNTTRENRRIARTTDYAYVCVCARAQAEWFVILAIESSDFIAIFILI